MAQIPYIDQLGKLPDRELAELHGVTRQAVSKARRARGIASPGPGSDGLPSRSVAPGHAQACISSAIDAAIAWASGDPGDDSLNANQLHLHLGCICKKAAFALGLHQEGAKLHSP